MTPTDNEYLAEIKARADAATEGPWAATSHEVDIGYFQVLRTLKWDVNGPHAVVSFHSEKAAEPDAEFIAHARQDVPKLLAMVQERDAEIGRWQKHAKDYLDELTRVLLINERLRKQFEVARNALEAVLDYAYVGSEIVVEPLAELDRLENDHVAEKSSVGVKIRE